MLSVLDILAEAPPLLLLHLLRRHKGSVRGSLNLGFICWQVDTHNLIRVTSYNGIMNVHKISIKLKLNLKLKRGNVNGITLCVHKIVSDAFTCSMLDVYTTRIKTECSVAGCRLQHHQNQKMQFLHIASVASRSRRPDTLCPIMRGMNKFSLIPSKRVPSAHHHI